MPPRPFGSYPDEDVTFLLTDLSDRIEETSFDVRERLMASGGHYAESLPVEYWPSPTYQRLYTQAVTASAREMALGIAVIAEVTVRVRGEGVVLVSLARAGTPIGVLMHRYLRGQRGLDVPHYSVSIVRDRGIDQVAVAWLRHHHPDAELQFVDGWTGKGTIQHELAAACRELGLDARLAVVADPGDCAHFVGTSEDVLVPTACLNATVSGLISRTVVNDGLIGHSEFHGAKWYRELAAADVSNDFVDAVAREYPAVAGQARAAADDQLRSCRRPGWSGRREAERIARVHGLDLADVKPGVGETTRVLLRRRPRRILVRPDRVERLPHIVQLAQERGVDLEEYPDMGFAACGLVARGPAG